jgi:hypothetical protein
MIHKREIRLLPFNTWQYLRIIKCQGKEMNNYLYFICYLRDSKYKELDELDNCILNSLKSNQNAEFYLCQEIYREGQQEEFLNNIELDELENVTIQLNPEITESLFEQVRLGFAIYGYIKNFNIRFRKGHNFIHCNKYFTTSIEYNLNLELENTITPI